MKETITFALTLLAALGSGLIGGVFFAFSGFIMKALARLTPAQGVAAMQSINVAAVTLPLMIPLFGTALVSGAVGITSIMAREEPGAPWRIAGSLLYLLGAVGVTIACNVPRNNALAAVDLESVAAVSRWAGYVPSWTAWNSVRTAAAMAAALAFTVALIARR